MITLSTNHLSADGLRASIDENKSRIEVTGATALAALRAFAAVPALALAGLDSKIYLTGPKEKIAVQNSRGKLLVALMPEVLNTWEECTPEQTLVRLTGDASLAESAVAALCAAENGARVAVKPSRLRKSLSSRVLLVGLVVIATVMAWMFFSPDTPDGVTIIHDSARISQLHEQINGRYGAGDQLGRTISEFKNGKFRTLRAGQDGLDTLVVEATYQYGLRDNTVVLVVDNGAAFNPQADGSLKFLDTVYPRLAKAKL